MLDSNDRIRAEFNHLSFDKKCGMVYDYGVYLDQFIAGEYKIFLYVMGDGAFVEVFYAKKGRVVDVVMPSYKQLDIYLDQLYLAGMRNNKGFYIMNTTTGVYKPDKL